VRQKHKVVRAVKSENGESSACTLSESQLARVWTEEVLPFWDKRQRSKKTRDLVYAGLPTNLRGRVWELCAGNELNITLDLFELLLEQSHASRIAHREREQKLRAADGDVGGFGGHAEAAVRESADDDKSASERFHSHCRAIALDLPRTFPDLAFFHSEESVYYRSLQEVLEAYTCFRPEVGYVQGMSYIAAKLLLYLEKFEAFKLFVHMMHHKSMLFSFFTMRMVHLRAYLCVFGALMRDELPQLATHFAIERVEPEMYVVNWVMSMFCRTLSLDAASRVWDLYFYEGEAVVLRTAVAVLKLLQARLLEMQFDEIAHVLTRSLEPVIQVEPLVDTIRSVHLSSSRFREKVSDFIARGDDACKPSGGKSSARVVNASPRMPASTASAAGASSSPSVSRASSSTQRHALSPSRSVEVSAVAEVLRCTPISPRHSSTTSLAFDTTADLDASDWRKYQALSPRRRPHH